MELGGKAVELAVQSIGVKETSTNWSKWIKIYLAFVGIFKPAPWCAAFLCYKIHQAAGVLKVKTKWPKSASVQSIFQWADKCDLISMSPATGRAFVVWHSELHRYAHIGFIAGVRHSSKGIEFLTVEGNSNDDGSREGKEVVSEWRLWSNRHRSIMIV